MAETRLAAGVDPMDPKILEEMRAGAEQVETANRPPASLVEAQDLTDAQTIAGFRCRPMSAGLLALLEMTGSPILDGDAESGFTDMLVLMFLLLADAPEDDLIDLAQRGYPALKREALKWSFGLDVDTMREIQTELPALLSRFQNTLDLYGGGDDGDGDKKK